MKHRVLKAINKELEKNPDSDFLKKQKKLINTANISTLHSFCYKLIKEHFYKLGIKSNIQISSDEDVILLREEILNDILEEKYAENVEISIEIPIDKIEIFIEFYSNLLGKNFKMDNGEYNKELRLEKDIYILKNIEI